MGYTLIFGTHFIIWLQSFSNDSLDAFFRYVTLLGDEEFYLLFLPLVFWCIDKRVGLRLAFLSLLSTYANAFLKDVFAIPRPSDPRIRQMVGFEGYSFPSQHAQGTTVIWGYLASQYRSLTMGVVAVIIPILVSLSRLYLGVHYLQDIIGGIAIGALLILAFNWAVSAAGKMYVPPAAKAVGVLLLPLGLLALHLTAAAARAMGSLLGMGVGILLEEEFVRFKTRGPWWKQLLKLAIGLAVSLALWAGLKMVFPEAIIFRLLRYGVVGLWVTFFAPWLFVKTFLAEQEG